MSGTDPRCVVEAPEVPSDGLFDLIEGWQAGFRRVMALRAAVRLSLFGMTREPVSPEALAGSAGWDPVMTRMLLRCLADMGLLTETAGGYVNSAQASLYLDPSSDRHQGTSLSVMMARTDLWRDLDAIVRDGPPTSDRDSDREAWIRGIGESALGGVVARTVDSVERAVGGLTGTFLDLGGGHGLYTVAFCARNPGLRATLFDLPGMMHVAGETLSACGCEAELRAGDFYEDDLGGPYDVVFSSFNHSTSDPSMCGRVFAAVAPGGLLILNRHLDPGPPDPLRVLEWNLTAVEGTEKGARRLNGSWLPASEEYLVVMTGLGMEAVSRERMDGRSELVVMRRPERGQMNPPLTVNSGFLSSTSGFLRVLPELA